MGEALDVFYLVEGEVEGDEVCEGVEALDVRDEVVVEVDFSEGRGHGDGNVDCFDFVLAEAEALSGYVSVGKLEGVCLFVLRTFICLNRSNRSDAMSEILQ